MREHGFDVGWAEDGLEGVEREARELGLDEVRAVLHDGFEALVALGALPPWDQVEQVDAFRRLSCVLAGVARELYGEAGEHGQAGGGVPLAHEAGVEVDFRSQRGDPDESRVAHDE